MRLGRVDDVGELDAVLDEEHRDIVADQVEVPLLGVEPHEHGRLDPFGEETCTAHLCGAAVADERPVGSRTRGVDDRSGIRSWSNCIAFSRRWWSWSSVGPRSRALREWSVSAIRTPVAVVR